MYQSVGNLFVASDLTRRGMLIRPQHEQFRARQSLTPSAGPSWMSHEKTSFMTSAPA